MYVESSCMNEKNKFTVLMSLYFKEKPEALNDCLLSLNDQTIRIDEIVIVYDGPISSELNEVVLNWCDILPIKIYKLSQNLGLGDALNYGIQKCSNELIARMDTDDICLPNRFEKQIAYMIENPNVTLVGGAIEEFDEMMCASLGARFTKEKHEDIIEYAIKKNPFNHMTVMFRKKDIQNVGGYQKHMFMEDYNLWLRILSKGYRTYNFPDVLVRARTGANMIRRRKGLGYIKSEYQLFKLKRTLGFGHLAQSYFLFVIRVIPRLLPTFLLSRAYYFLRK